MNKISVIMPAFNCEKYINRAINSVLSQTYENIELIIIDDSSTDNTLDLCKSYKDERVKLLHNTKNSGVSFSRNRGLSNATGDYIFFLDADDYIENTLFDKIINIDNFEFYDFVVVGKIFDCKNIYSKAILPLKQGEYNLYELIKNDINSFLDVSIGVWITNKLYKKRIVGSVRFEDGLSNGEDVKFGCEILRKSENFYVLEDYGTFYNRDNQESLSKAGVRNILNTYILQITCHRQVVSHFRGECGHDFYSNYMRFACYCIQKLLACTFLSKEDKLEIIKNCIKIYDFNNEVKYAESDFANKIKEAFITKNYKLLMES